MERISMHEENGEPEHPGTKKANDTKEKEKENSKEKDYSSGEEKEKRRKSKSREKDYPSGEEKESKHRKSKSKESKSKEKDYSSGEEKESKHKKSKSKEKDYSSGEEKELKHRRHKSKEKDYSSGEEKESKHSSRPRSREKDYSSGEEKESKHSRPKSISSRHILTHKRNVLGEIIYKGHPSWVLMQNIQTGIRHYVGRSSELLPENKLTTLDDTTIFDSPKVLRFPTEGSKETLPHKTGLFKFKDYCPVAFRHLRQKFHIDPADYMVSLCNTLEDGMNALRELPTPGKSGSLFFFSHDMKYILKTIPKREAKLLRMLLPAYYKHVMENTDTLLPRFFGLHRVKPHKGRQVRFVVMGNVFATSKKIHERFDLKGSTLGRSASEEEKATLKEMCTYKDNDWREQNRKLKLGPHLRQLFLEQLKKDCATELFISYGVMKLTLEKLLEKLNVMDYSLLVGIHHCDWQNGNDCSFACMQAEQPADDKKAQKSKVSGRKHRKKLKKTTSSENETAGEAENGKSDSHDAKSEQKEQQTHDKNKSETNGNSTEEPKAHKKKSKKRSKESGNDTKESKMEETSNGNHTDKKSSDKGDSETEKKNKSEKKGNSKENGDKELAEKFVALTEVILESDKLKESEESKGQMSSSTSPTTASPLEVLSEPELKSDNETRSPSKEIPRSEPVKRVEHKRMLSGSAPESIVSKIVSFGEMFTHSNNAKKEDNGPKAQTNFPLPEKLLQGHSVFQGDDGGMRGVDADGTKLNEYYFVGVIDILMLYTIRKKAEHVYKSLRFADSPTEVSSVDPHAYSKRFQAFMAQITE